MKVTLTPLDPTSLDEVVFVPARRRTRLLVLSFLMGSILIGLSVLLLAESMWARAAGGIGALAVARIGWGQLGRMRGGDDGLRIDAEGIRLPSLGAPNPSLRWEEIERFEMTFLLGQTYVAVHVRDPKAAIDALPTPWRVVSKLNQRMTGTPFHIPTSGLAANPIELILHLRMRLARFRSRERPSGEAR